MSRIENGLHAGSTEDTAALLAVYGCVGPQHTELPRLAHEVDRRGSWQRKPTFNERVGTLVNLEKKAELVVNFECTNVPGLLQLPEYTDALLRECKLVPADKIEHRVRARALRHSILLGPKPTRLLALVDEQVLARMIGSPAVMQRLILEEPDEIETYERAIRLLARRALSAGESLLVITELARRREQG